MIKNSVQRLAQTTRHLNTAPASLSSPRFARATTPRSFTSASTRMAPSGLIANKGLELLTWGTPNGHKITILLEELKEAYGKDYVFQAIPIGENIQKQDWFTKLGPNGRIPVLVDHDNGGFAIMEGAAILAYLTRHYDSEHKFSFTDDKDLSTQEQWIAWQHGGLGPMQGQANHFIRAAKEKIGYGMQRYHGEAERLLGVLDHRLEGRDYLAGPGKGKYSTADIANFSWVNWTSAAQLDLKKWKNLYAWWERVLARPAVQKGLNVPSEPKLTNSAHAQRLQSEPDFAKAEGEHKERVAKAQKDYDYKYASP